MLVLFLDTEYLLILDLLHLGLYVRCPRFLPLSEPGTDGIQQCLEFRRVPCLRHGQYDPFNFNFNLNLNFNFMHTSS